MGHGFGRVIKGRRLGSDNDRWIICEASPAWERSKRGHFNQEIGRSKGGLTTKIHAVVDGLGNPVRIHLTGGNVNDIVPANELINGLHAGMTIADKAYDADRFTDLIRKQGSEVVIPPTRSRLDQRWYDKHLYKERHLVECFFAKIKVFRRISTRYDKLAVTFRAAVLIAACMTWLQ